MYLLILDYKAKSNKISCFADKQEFYVGSVGCNNNIDIN